MKTIMDFISLFLSMVFKPYIPKRVYVSQKALGYPRTQHMISRIKKLNRKALIIYIPTNTPPRPNLTGKALYKFLKETIVICVRSAPYMEIFASPGKVSENLGLMGKIVSHCSLRCLYCYLDVSGRGTPWTRVYVDLENFYDQVISERLVYKMTLTLWSAISFYLKTPLDKVPIKFKEIVDHTIRMEILKKHSTVTSDSEAIRYLKRHIREFFQKMGINITHQQAAQLKKEIQTYYNKNKNNPLWINVSEYSDVLAFDPISNQVEELMQKVQKDPQFNFKLRTKVANIHPFLKYDGKDQVQVTFSLNTEYVIKKYEKDSSSLDQMIAAVNSLIQKGGFKILIAIEPIIKYKGYEDDYRDLIKKMKKEIDLSKVVRIKIGTVRYKTRMKNYIKNVHPRSGLFSANQQLVEPEPGDKRWRYSRDERLKIYKVIQDELKSIPSIKLGIASEYPELWNELGLDKTDIHSGVVYQYVEEKK
jgi:DNA repair photolyase